MKEVFNDHPLEELLDIESGSTEQTSLPVVIEPIDPVQPSNYDDKDMEVERKLEEVYATAIANVKHLSEEISHLGDGDRGKARLVEVTATMLNVALNAAKEKGSLKMHKDKHAPVGGENGNGSGNGSTINNLVVTDRNTLLEMMGKKKEVDVDEQS